MLRHIAPLLCLAAGCVNTLAAKTVHLTSTPRVIGRTVYIEGTTDLPDSTVIEWELRHESLFKRHDIPISRMATEGHTVVRGRRYVVAVDLSAWPSGQVEVWVAFQPLSYGTRQPAFVSRLFGHNGQFIEGPNVKLHPAQMRRVELIEHIQIGR